MQIALSYVDTEVFPVPAGWIAVGFLGTGPAVLAYDPARAPHSVLDGVPTPLDPASVNPVLAGAIEAAATRAWPEGWSYALAESFAINRRALQRDRLAKNTLHPNILRTLGAVSEGPDAEGMGRILRALASYATSYGEGHSMLDRIDDAGRVARNAVEALRQVHTGRPIRPEPVDADNCKD
ncbi:hypothetical protein [Methylobacterium sp. J-092]|uniref:hypothetical protein n=1 Tax=Methylobacterium sp. J-092 TaxID=2836667 RepID=UPI001FBACD9C|nr:hypothetical protein [Methylobacterium sp. J-092]MCJ2006740.1 hypothetical protein [Methylobacterium sp. J-092]